MNLKGCIDKIIFKVWSESGEFINKEKHPLGEKKIQNWKDKIPGHSKPYTLCTGKFAMKTKNTP